MAPATPPARNGATLTLMAACTVAAFLFGFHSAGGGGGGGGGGAGDISRGGFQSDAGMGSSATADGGPAPSPALPDSFFIPVTSRVPLPADKVYPSRTPTRTPHTRPSQIPPAPSPSPSPSPAPPKHMPRVAIGIRARPLWMEHWRALLNAMKLRDEIALFFSLWKEEANEALVASWRAEPNSPLASVKFEPTGTYTTGRNMNIRTMYAAEVARGKRFESWVIADADAAFVECYRCPVTRLPDVTGAACCMDYFIGLALNRAYNFSQVSSILAWEEYPPFEAQKNSEVIDRMFMFRDCADGQLQAYHRDIVPVVFPYHEELEDVSWWSSQGILFRYTSGCAPGSSVLPGRNLKPNEQEHVPYNRGERDIGREAALVRDTFPELADFPLNQATNPAFFCQDQSAQRGVVTLDPSSGHPDVVDWRATEAFKKCLRVKEPWFVQHAGGGVPQAPR
jgi:hypothetical protein